MEMTAANLPLEHIRRPAVKVELPIQVLAVQQVALQLAVAEVDRYVLLLHQVPAAWAAAVRVKLDLQEVRVPLAQLQELPSTTEVVAVVEVGYPTKQEEQEEQVVAEQVVAEHHLMAHQALPTQEVEVVLEQLHLQ